MVGSARRASPRTIRRPTYQPRRICNTVQPPREKSTGRAKREPTTRHMQRTHTHAQTTSQAVHYRNQYCVALATGNGACEEHGVAQGGLDALSAVPEVLYLRERRQADGRLCPESEKKKLAMPSHSNIASTNQHLTTRLLSIVLYVRGRRRVWRRCRAE